MSTAAVPVSPIRVALVGAPNSGKTTVFNALTGARAKVGNYPGVTVERREGAMRKSARAVNVLDLPGSYSLRGETLDEQVVERVLEGELDSKPDALLIVVDATTLQRSLAMVLEALEAHAELPSALVVTMIDEMRARGGKIDFNKLSKTLGTPVFPVVGHRGVGIDAVFRALEKPEDWSRPKTFPRSEGPEARYAWVDEVCADIGATKIKPDTRSDRVDRWLLHPFVGVIVFEVVVVVLQEEDGYRTTACLVQLRYLGADDPLEHRFVGRPQDRGGAIESSGELDRLAGHSHPGSALVPIDVIADCDQGVGAERQTTIEQTVLGRHRKGPAAGTRVDQQAESFRQIGGCGEGR